ncbi:hypothetical protein ALC60_01239 [Trachymyrmex zeteki]|uniref:Uncharacterized protein n=1 Tax=Mycetomoellerius zeteki TaxID=64791 RepID=A0A151XHR2_9HYME|nr:hypothetical protein ALC60_01239 [Trachymyrmex zeteki]
MDAVKKQRKVFRMAFTKALTAFTTKMNSDCSKEDKMVAFQFLETKMTELDTMHSAYNQALFQSDLDVEVITKELESDDTYKSQYLTAKMRIMTVIELVKSFSPTGENYVKAITSLKNRFGRDDIVLEFYVRELLGLVLQNALKGNKKLALSGIYDKVECYIRALEILGVTTDKCAAMLYPLVESSLPEEVLRAWQRSGQREDRKEGTTGNY